MNTHQLLIGIFIGMLALLSCEQNSHHPGAVSPAVEPQIYWRRDTGG
jgi:hypothetical protein